MTAAGLEVAASVAGIATLCVIVFEGCVKAIQIISEARCMGRSVEKASMMLEWEEFRLLRWGESVGLHAGRNHDPRLNWSLIHDLLEHLLRDVLDAEKLRSKYNLDVVEEAGAGDPSASTIVGPVRQRSVPGQTWRHVSPAIRQSRERILQQKSGIWSKLKWIKVDEEKTRKLLADISYFNTALQECLDAAQQDFMKQGMAALLRDLLSRTTSGAEVETIDDFLGEEAVAGHKALQAPSQQGCLERDRFEARRAFWTPLYSAAADENKIRAPVDI